MANMSYCRFHNTYLDLRDCYENWDEEISEEEKSYRNKLLDLCTDIYADFGLVEDE